MVIWVLIHLVRAAVQGIGRIANGAAKSNAASNCNSQGWFIPIIKSAVVSLHSILFVFAFLYISRVQ